MNIRILAALLLAGLLHGCGGGGGGGSTAGPAAPGTSHLPNLAFSSGAPTTPGVPLVTPAVVGIADTGRRGQRRHRLECDVTFDGFLDANCGDGREGHFVVMTRATLAGVATGDFRGIGWIAGSLWQGSERPPFALGDFTKCAAIESWQNGLNAHGWPWIKPGSLSPQLVDGRTYRVVFESEPVPGGWMARLRVGDFDSGPVFDDNPNIDAEEQAIAFAALGASEVRVENVVSTWS